MYLYADYSSKINEYLDWIRKIKQPDSDIQSKMTLHGTYASGKALYITDVDCEYFIKYTDDRKRTVEYVQYFIHTIIANSERFIFVRCLAGLDDRFVFPYIVKKNGSIEGYDSKIIKKRLAAFRTSAVITAEEFNKVNALVLAQPTTIDLFRLNNELDTLAQIFWTSDEIAVGRKTYRGKEFLLEDALFYPTQPTILTV